MLLLPRYILLTAASVLLLIFWTISGSEVASGYTSRGAVEQPIAPPFLADSSAHWVDSVMKKLTPDERIGQLFMIAAWSNKDQKHVTDISNLIRNNKIGGLIFMQGGPVRQANLINKYQKLSKVPLMIAMDAEWGLSMRIDSTVVFPRQMTLGAMQNDSLIYQMGLEMARQCKRMGVQVSFSPDADVNNNSANPVIGTRSFGENKYLVARKAKMYMRGLQDGGVLACGKHFPGHGDTDSDSHKTLPVIRHSRERMDSLELYPFRELIASGLGSMMVAHLYVPAYDTAANKATTLSKFVVDTLLKQQLGFKGLVFTDALNMKGVSKFYREGEVDVKALLAGNDVLLFSGDVPKAVIEIKAAIERGEITQQEIDRRCRKILAAKYWTGLHKKQHIDTRNLINDLNTPEAEWICRQMAEKSLTVLKNENTLIPFINLDTLSIATVSIGEKNENKFRERMSFYAPQNFISVSADPSQSQTDSLINAIQENDVVILSLQSISQRPANNFLLPQRIDRLIDTLYTLKKKIVLVVFGSAYSVNNITSADRCDAVIMAYENQPYMQDMAAQLIFGGISASGKLPVSLHKWKSSRGVATIRPIRFKYTVPEELGFDRKVIGRMDSIIADGISKKAYPGCQLFAAKDGKVFICNSYGYFTYENKRKVNNRDLYDLASVTKIMASTPALMKMQDERKVNVDSTLAAYLPALKGTNKENITFREVFAHQSGLPAWIPFWTKTVDKDGNLKRDIYRKSWSDSFPIYVAPGIFIAKHYNDTLFKWIVDCKMQEKKNYVYSDLGYYFLRQIIEKQTRMLMSDYVMKTFYQPLGLTTMGYQPRLRFPSAQCAPTENDKKFRKQQLQGDVHDQGAAMLGGIGGHAGVFSNANDVGVMMQLFLNYGAYGGRRYFDSATVADFTRYQFPENENRRGLCFDKPEKDPKKPNPACNNISLNSFGHQGFTGTQAWADPETGIVYVFLSNRVYPDAEENKLAKLGIRTKLLQEIITEVKK
ncbi:MAG: glycoside hydrolase family 3 N-terminal domain-containing protein [Bacteroidia bacterium]